MIFWVKTFSARPPSARKCLDVRTRIGFHPRIAEKTDCMLTFIGRLLFPRSQRWKQRQQARLLLAALAVGLLFGIITVGIMLLGNRHPQ